MPDHLDRVCWEDLIGHLNTLGVGCGAKAAVLGSRMPNLYGPRASAAIGFLVVFFLGSSSQAADDAIPLEPPYLACKPIKAIPTVSIHEKPDGRVIGKLVAHKAYYLLPAPPDAAIAKSDWLPLGEEFFDENFARQTKTLGWVRVKDVTCELVESTSLGSNGSGGAGVDYHKIQPFTDEQLKKIIGDKK